jgi:hypothetical protein
VRCEDEGKVEDGGSKGEKSQKKVHWDVEEKSKWIVKAKHTQLNTHDACKFLGTP